MKTPTTVRVLGIETSCDETAISLIEVDGGGRMMNILGDTVHSQIDVHTPYGGVFPTLAKREHQRNLVPVLEKTLKQAGMLGRETKTKELSSDIKKILEREPELSEAFEKVVPTIKKPDIDFISVTAGPGLEPALWVGINFARALGAAWNIPIVPVNHMEGHIMAALIKKSAGYRAKSVDDEKIDSTLHPPHSSLHTPPSTLYTLLSPSFPALSLLISGGHTQIVLVDRDGAPGGSSMSDALSYRIVGETKDDAIGECFDKTARTLGLAYPGGPKISKLAAEARQAGIGSPEPLPRPMIDSDSLDFSFSGLKTAVLYLVKRLKDKGTVPGDKSGDPADAMLKGICREIEDAVTDVVVAKMRAAVEKYAVSTLIIGGGVIANAHIRTALERLASECSLALLMPETGYSTDNGLMIALAGYFHRAESVPASEPVRASGTLALGPRG